MGESGKHRVEICRNRTRAVDCRHCYLQLYCWIFPSVKPANRLIDKGWHTQLNIAWLDRSATQADRVFGPGVIGGPWIAPQALRQLRPGRIIDTDPVTRVTVSVGQESSTPQGNTTIGIIELNTAQRIEYRYDLSSGMLVFVDSFNKIINQQTQLRVSRWQWGDHAAIDCTGTRVAESAGRAA